MGVLFKNSDITIYNKYYNSALDLNEYQRTVIRGVNWQGKKTGTVSDVISVKSINELPEHFEIEGV